MPQAVQRAEAVGQSGFFPNALEHGRDVAARLVVVTTGKDVGACGTG